MVLRGVSLTTRCSEKERWSDVVDHRKTVWKLCVLCLSELDTVSPWAWGDVPLNAEGTDLCLRLLSMVFESYHSSWEKYLRSDAEVAEEGGVAELLEGS